MFSNLNYIAEAINYKLATTIDEREIGAPEENSGRT